MINPNKKSRRKGSVVELIRRPDGSIRHLVIELDCGLLVEGVAGLEHKTLAVADFVTCVVGYRITSERYVVESIRRDRKRAKELKQFLDNVTYDEIMTFISNKTMGA